MRQWNREGRISDVLAGVLRDGRGQVQKRPAPKSSKARIGADNTGGASGPSRSPIPVTASVVNEEGPADADPRMAYA